MPIPLMPPAYFKTHFRDAAPNLNWPATFAIITAYATTGETWSLKKNQAADRALETELRATGLWLQRLTGYSPVSGHAEASWAVELPVDAACEIGCRYLQDALYYVIADALHITYCDAPRRALVAVAPFRARLTATQTPSIRHR